uniref:Uncharacterized protein n=1 Tax=Anguilla anguilla TaxID=7936 RepID=A0A0E9QVR9_ANGAN
MNSLCNVHFPFPDCNI